MFFFQHGKDAHRDSAKGALNDSSRSLIWSFWEQIVFLEICEKLSKVSDLDQFWVHPRWSKIIWNFVKTLENCGSEPCARPLGYGGWLGASKPLVLALRRALRGFFSAKKGSKNQIIRIYQKNIHLCLLTDNIII